MKYNKRNSRSRDTSNSNCYRVAFGNNNGYAIEEAID